METAALWKLWKNHSKEGDHPLVISPPVSTALGKLSAKKQNAESFPQFPQLRRLGFFPGKKPVSRRRLPRLVLCGDILPCEGPPASGRQGLAARKQSRSRLRSSLSLTAPFIGHSLGSGWYSQRFTVSVRGVARKSDAHPYPSETLREASLPAIIASRRCSLHRRRQNE